MHHCKGKTKKQDKTRSPLHNRIRKNEFYLNHPGFIIIGSPKFNLIIHCTALEWEVFLE